VGGTIGVIAFLTFFTGTEVGLQGYAALNQLGTSNCPAGRRAGPVGHRRVRLHRPARAMRISEEVDALEVMGVPSLPFLVTTRMIAGFVAVTPLYVIGLLSSYFAARTITTGF